MKSYMAKLLSLLLVLVVVGSAVIPASAAGKVTYDGDARNFIFEPGSEYSPTDLFSDYKNVMPGDSLTQRVTVRNDASNEVKVKIYMRSLGAHEDSVEFLYQLRMTVRVVSDPETAYMFDAPADQTDGLTEWVLLGTLYSGGEVDLEVTLDVPIELGNEFQNAIGYLDWQFMVEEFPIEPDDPEPPKTGDDFNVIMFAALAAVSALAVVILLILGRRRKKEN